ncbi:hypothetical protein AJ80_07164 [Polytolypa hystricis UAMH7299]|uniref:prephenate dehydratase n=1 Tax=Polytolypa hystricis (strain UAMH7299) TaxID=1447883 RepID=A0A2B7XRI9_POLH7|nr:hypothetical protein AJ80_07164 [Polytolypa hystricis UAMH7299]
MAANTVRVAFLGPLASFSHQAALETFGPTATLLPQPSFPDALSSVQSNTTDYAILPFENSTNGAVVQAFDLLADREGKYPDITVCGEHYLTVHQCLLVKKGYIYEKGAYHKYTPIKKLYTHPQAWGQCETFLTAHFKGIERQDSSSTSKAAETVAKEEDGYTSAAIASKFAAELHGLDVLDEDIEDKEGNTTRFLVVGNRRGEAGGRMEEVRVGRSGGDSTTTTPTTPTAGIIGESGEQGSIHDQQQQQPQKPKQPKQKTLISFMVEHGVPGALANALTTFQRHGMNLTSINSRPSGVQPWQYIFFIECERDPGLHGGEVIEEVMRDLRGVTEACRYLGSWRDQLG